MTLNDFLTAAGRGAAADLARELGVRPVMLSQWSGGAKAVADDRCPAIERATEGKVTCEDLRPDVVWTRVADHHWPWHPAGRPLIDVAAALVAQPEAQRDAA